MIFHVMAKPLGPICNLDCHYCYYTYKKQLFKSSDSFRMSQEVLENYIQQYITSSQGREIEFVWQGGEPTLLGVEFFRLVVELQEKYSKDSKISNTLQTNGTLVTDQWCEFLKQNDFLVGISIDGPRNLHDSYRRDKKGDSSFDAVVNTIKLLRKHGVRFNTLTAINDKNSEHPLEVYRFLKDIGDGYIQCIPIVERLSGEVTPWSVRPNQLARFYMDIYDEWIAQDVGKVFVQFFDAALGNWLGVGGGVCHFSPECGKSAILEHNGNLYACDHYVSPRFKRGNIMLESLEELMGSETQKSFGAHKRTGLMDDCLQCNYKFACHGDCPKHRFETSSAGTCGLSYLCSAYKKIFSHIDASMTTMVGFVKSGLPASKIMNRTLWGREGKAGESVKRNDPCPCKSGIKYKKCCGVF